MSRNSRLQRIFNQKTGGEKVMSLFVTAGFPDPSATVDLVLELEASGADIIELGMPFSDPLADGPTIQYASKVALDKGVTLNAIFSMVSDIRRHSDIPIVLMGYINPVFRYGIEAFFYKAKQCGVDGIILPDVPLDEFPEVSEWCRQTGIDPVYLVAPNTPDKRMQEIDQASSGFVYCVSVTGVTGSRESGEISRSVNSFIQRVRKNVTKNPVLIGFGICSHEDAMAISAQVSGFIVGSALIEVIRDSYPEPDWIRRTAHFVRSLKHGVPEDA